MSDVTTLADFASELLSLANDCLSTTPAGAIDRAFVSPSLPALDCCPQLTVDVRSLTLEVTAPTTPLTALGHRLSVSQSALYVATLVITVVRCTPVIEQNSLPSITDMEAAATAANEDLWAIWNGVATAKRAGTLFGGNCPALYVDPPVPLPAEGGCVGWVIPYRPAIDGYAVALPS